MFPLKLFTPAVPNLFGTRDRFCGRQFFYGLGVGDGSGRNASDGKRQMKLHLLAAHLLLRGPVPNRLWTNIGPWPGDWGPLLYANKRMIYIFQMNELQKS